MNAPETNIDTEARHMNLPVDSLIASKTNPRKRKGLDEASLNELATSIKAVGVAQPILVRPQTTELDGGDDPEVSTVYEIIAGERRWRAAKIAGLQSVPVILRELDDLQVLKIQLAENSHREDLDALEEAEGYEKLMQQSDAEGNPYTAETIAHAMGVSKGTIYARLKLLAMCQDARQAFYDGKLEASNALLIARIPVEKLQLQALKYFDENYDKFNNRPMPHRRFKDYVQNEFMLDLENAPFDTKDFLLIKNAGTCTDCTKRTGNQPELFDEDLGKDICTDTVCFGMKKAAAILKIQKEAEHQGHTVIKGKAAKKLITSQYNEKQQLKDHGLAPLDERIPGDKEGRTFGEALQETKLLEKQTEDGKPVIQKTLVENPRTKEMIPTVNMEDAMKVLREAGFEISAKKTNNSAEREKQEKENAKRKELNQIEIAYRQHLFRSTHDAITAAMNDPMSAIAPQLYRMLALKMFTDANEYGDADDLLMIMSAYIEIPAGEDGAHVDSFNAFDAKINEMNPQQLFSVICDFMLMDELLMHIKPEMMTSIATTAGIDFKALQVAAKTEVKAATKEASKAKETV